MASKSRKNNVKFKWTKELIALIVALVAVITATIIMSIPDPKLEDTNAYNEAIQAYNTANSTSYSYLPNENVFTNVEYDELKDVLSKDGKVYVLYGSINSPIFLQYLSYINSVATEEDVEEVYILSSLWYEEAEDVEAEEFKSELKTKQEFLNNGKLADVSKFEFAEYPALLVFENGNLTFNSQTYSENTEATWNHFVQKVFVVAE